MRTIDGTTGEVIDDTASQNAQTPTAPNANQIAQFFGVPVPVIVVIGLALLIVPQLFKRR